MPELTLGYVREMARVLRPGGWAVFGLSTDPAVHRPRRRVRWRLAGLRLERVRYAGTQFTVVLARRTRAAVT